MKLLAPKDIAGQYCCDYGRGIECRHMAIGQVSGALRCSLYKKTVRPAIRSTVSGSGGWAKKCGQCTDALAGDGFCHNHEERT